MPAQRIGVANLAGFCPLFANAYPSTLRWVGVMAEKARVTGGL
jgi:hypothetical protein